MTAGDLVLCSGYTVVCCGPDGTIDGEGRHGLYDADARLLRLLRWSLGGAAPRLVGGEQTSSHRWQGVLVATIGSADRGVAGPELPQDALQLKVDRMVGPGMLDRLVVTNHSGAPWKGELSLELETDFADVQEIERTRRQQGELAFEVDQADEWAMWTYRASRGRVRFERRLKVRLLERRRVRFDATRLAFPIEVDPHASWSVQLRFESQVDGAWRFPTPGSDRDGWAERWAARRTRIEGPGWAVPVLERAADDLGSLRQWDWPADEAAAGAPDVDRPTDELVGHDASWFPNAGVPFFTGFFGRDTLTAGYQAGLLGPEMLRGALSEAARTQSRVDDAWHDAEPGKMVHEIRRGPLSMLDLIPQAGYYGSQTTGAIFVLALSEAWHWTGDDEVLRRYRAAALRTFEWARESGDLDGDGFLEYRRRSERGLKNQGWKDSDEAIRYPDGAVVDDPIATVEEQAFHCLALERMAEVLVALEEPDAADAYLREAHELRHRWHEQFWLENEAFYALALDPAKRPVGTVTSNPGHALGAGTVPVYCARRVADRLLAADLFSGWGVRTLSSAHPSFNPYAYHLGTVWPVEQATFALGFKRYGLDEHLDTLVEAFFGAAHLMPNGRLPELLAGVARSEAHVPLAYPGANSPQAWSASATIQMLQATLGLYPFAPLGLLILVRPRLPECLPEVTLRNLRIGEATVTIRFVRRDDGTAQHQVLEQHGHLLIVPAAAPQSALPGDLVERLEAALLRFVPGRLARAARIALGVEPAR